MENSLFKIVCVTLFSISVVGCGGSSNGGSDEKAEKAPLSSKSIIKPLNLKLPVSIPVVFHVIQQQEKPETAVADYLIHAQLEVLNQAFNQSLPELKQLDQSMIDLSGNAQIQFHLATTTPEGTPSTGINRISWSISDPKEEWPLTFGRNSPFWDPTHYLNVWVDDLSSLNSGIVGLAGKTQRQCDNVEKDQQDPVDGIEIHYGTMLNEPGIEGKKALLHEVGHWLTLSHTTEGENHCSLEGDRTIAEMNGQFGGHMETTQKFCDRYNIMKAYTDDSKLILFTDGQVFNMQQAFLENGCRERLYKNLTR